MRPTSVLLSGLLAGLATISGAGLAAAHVTVQPGEAIKDGYAKLTFRVPNESSTAGTIKLEVQFPLDTPIASLRTKPTPGWTAEIRTEQLTNPVKSGQQEITKAVRSITWTAQPGFRIGPGEFNEFEVSGGPMPANADRLLLPATQTYDDGKAVHWEAPPPADGAEEPEHPAPVLRLVAGDSDDGVTAESATAGTAPVVLRDDTARWLGGVSLAVAALGVGLAAGTIFAGRRRRAGSAAESGRGAD